MEEHKHCHNNRLRWVFIGFALVAGFFLFVEHRAHLFGWLPYLLFLACPLMHLFMHHDHGKHREDAADKQSGDKQDQPRNGDKP